VSADDDIDFGPSTETERIADGDAPVAVEELQVGALLDGRYEIRSAIGAGGAGRVYRAHDRVLGEEVAVKVLHPARAAHGKWIRRMAREVRVARAIRHPNVCRVFDLGQADGFCFVTMELAEGGTLRELLRARGAEDAATGTAFAACLPDARAVCAGLAAIHAAGITHRDVTPGNVLRMRDGRLVISDFGLAVGVDETTTLHGGTPQYMAPEVLAGAAADARADVWQLGMVLHQILFGRRPEWEHGGGRISLKRPPALPATPVAERAFALVASCLAHDPDARPPTAVEVARSLAEAETARSPTRAARAAAWMARRARRPAVRLAALAIVVGAGTYGVARLSAPAPRKCGGGRGRVGDVWDEATREAVRRKFEATGRAGATEVFAQASRLIDGHLADWVATYDDSCEATHVRGEQSADVLDLRTACLNDDLESVRALIRVFADADEALVDNAAAAAGSLTIARCSDVRALRFGPALPRDPEVRRRVAELRRSLGDARVMLEASRQRSSVRAAAEVAARAQQLGYKPLIAEALALEGQARADLLDFDRAIPVLERAVTLAEEGADDRVVARAAANLTYAISVDARSDAREWLTLAKAALVRIGGDPETAWLVHHAEVLYYLSRGEAQSALASGLEAVRIAERLFGPGHAHVGYSIGNVALAYERLGRFDEALAATDRALAIGRRWWDPGSIQMAKLANNRGEYLLALGRPGEAREMFASSLAAFEKETKPDSLLVSTPLVGLGRALLALGKTEEAVPLLERALRLRDHGDRIEPWVAEAEFRLAQALDAAGRDRARARRLAAAAQDGYAKAVGFAREREAVEAWASARR
jgi:tetratricopeptide (TPR) repeat protein